MAEILRYMLGNPHRLPQGYTPLSYIESTGTLYINTGWVPGVDSKVDVKIIPTTNSGTNPITCIATSDNKLIFECFLTNNYGTLYYAVNGSQDSTTNTLGSTASGNFSGPLHFIYTTDKFICNGVTLVSSTKPTINGTSQNCILLAYTPANGSIDSRHLSCKLYSFKGFDGETLMRDLIPAKNSSGVIGLFDCVSQTFFTNSGTGSFIAGPEVVVLPYEYLQVEYLESSGVEHINTNFTPNQNSRVEFLGCLTQEKASGSPEKWHACYSEDNSWNNSSFGAWFNDTVYSYYGVEQYGSGSTYGTSVGLKAILNKRFYVDLNKNVLYWKYIGDSSNQYSKTFDSSITFTGACPLVLLATNRNGSVLAQSHFIGKIEYSKIYDNGTLVRNMIPCYRRSDLKPGMYDTVNNVFYTNSGSGEFILGPVIEESSRQLEYNNAEQPNHFTNWRTASNWVSDGATVTLAGDYVQIAFSGEGNNRSYILSNNLWTTVGAKYLVSGWIRTTSGTSTVRFSRQIADYGNVDVSANTNWTNFSTVITATATSSTGSLSIQGTANTTIQLDNFKVIPITNSYTNYKGIPKNIHHSTSNPSSTLINLGSGKFVRSEKSMITTGALGISGDANFSISAWVKTVDAVTDYVGVVASSIYTPGKCFSLLLYGNKPDLDFWTGSGTDGGSRFIATNAISTGEWHHIVVTKAAGAPSTSNCKIYVDGALVPGSVVGTLAPNITNSPIIIGRLNDIDNRYFNGEMYDVRIYNNVLTADEVLKIYKGGL